MQKSLPLFVLSVWLGVLLVAGLPTVSYGATVTFDTDGVPVVDGRRTFMYGTMRDPSDDWRTFTGVRAGGFNLTHDYFFEELRWDLTTSGRRIGDWVVLASEYLDLAEQAGVGVMLGLPRRAVFDGNTAAIATAVQALRDKPALRFWTIMDEPLTRINDGLTPALVQTAYDTIKLHDTDHPAVLIDITRPSLNGPFTPAQMWAGSDAVFVDRYPIPSTGPTSEDLTPTYLEFQTVKGLVPTKTIGSVLQGHDLRTFFPDNNPVPLTAENILPTNAQLRAQFHLSVTAGAGVSTFYWAPRTRWDLVSQSPQQWQNFIDLGQEVAAIRPWLERGTESTQVTITAGLSAIQRNFTDDQVDLQAWNRRVDNDLVVAVVNPGGWTESTFLGWDDEVDARIDLPFDDYRQVSVLRDGVWLAAMTRDQSGWEIDVSVFDGLYRSFDGQRLTLSLDAFDTVVLRLSYRQVIPEPGAAVLLFSLVLSIRRTQPTRRSL